MINSQKTESIQYGGFWIRLVAWLIDGFILYFPVITIQLSVRKIFQNELTYEVINFFANLIIYSIYYTVLHASSWQATIGKKLLGLKVVDKNGNRITLKKSIFRLLSSILSAIILYIGYFMAGWDEKKRALHDRIVETFVVREKEKSVSRAKITLIFISLFVFEVTTMIYYVAIPKYEAKKKIAEDKTRSLIISLTVLKLKESLILPKKLSEVTTLVDITVEPNAVRYHYILYDAFDTANLTEDYFKELLIQGRVCENIKDILDLDINAQYQYAIDGSAKVYLIEFSKRDCLDVKKGL